MSSDRWVVFETRGAIARAGHLFEVVVKREPPSRRALEEAAHGLPYVAPLYRWSLTGLGLVGLSGEAPSVEVATRAAVATIEVLVSCIEAGLVDGGQVNERLVDELAVEDLEGERGATTRRRVAALVALANRGLRDRAREPVEVELETVNEGLETVEGAG